ncbi:DUF3179 domain-containing protein [Aquisalimonas sp. 2447]|uniref:DUF3179 domain-containing protein n=1 Tax=Aquisalimonas sp. 2447 TaxID=2740807 RepID=UPI00143231E5|nr:DUF3179 domain-containing protein [Aquisalimonas sp. 2447]QIT56091.1 DUF3179 domain-containing protein [Aquisalimonas sp. 2447]
MRTHVLTVLSSAALAVPALALGDTRLPVTDPILMPLEPSAYTDDMRSGGPGMDGIPSIDEPAFWSADRGDEYLEPEDRVIGVYRNGEARAYPQRILVWHEIVNDTIGGDNVAVTYCPLTGTALGFKRGEKELGVSGRLVNSNLIMFDRDTESFWPQILGAAINGEHEGHGLEEFRVIWTTWKQWRERHPETEVLTTDTGYVRNYRHDPYGNYNPLSGYYEPESDRIFPVQNENERYPQKHEVFGFRTSAGAVAVDTDHLADEGALTLEHGDHHYLVLHDEGLGTAWVFRGDETVAAPQDVTFGPAGPEHGDLDDLEPVNGFEAMWFAWAAFYPDTRVIDGQ